MRSIKQATATSLLLILAAVSAPLIQAGCGSEARCVPAAPPDLASYQAGIEDSRLARERAFRDPENSPVPLEELESWSGLDFYPVDPSYRLEGKLVRHSRPQRTEISATGGELRAAEEVGYFVLDLGAGDERLPLFRMLEGGHWFLPFLDATTEVETYPAGRYLEVEELPNGSFLLDFNEAYNPYCAYGGDWSCPITPESNRLQAAILAGERGYRYLQE